MHDKILGGHRIEQVIEDYIVIVLLVTLEKGPRSLYGGAISIHYYDMLRGILFH